MSRKVNFHMHSLYSDGVKSVPQLIEMLKKHEASWFSLTDHNSVGGFAQCRRLAKEAGLHCVSGIELSVPLEGCPHAFIGGEDNMHLLAYDFQPEAFASQSSFVNPKAAFAYIRKSGGISVWAHPYNLYRLGQKKQISPDEAADLASWLKKQGMDGLEAHYYDFSPPRRAELASLADSLSLIKGIGTDYHGWQGRDKPCMDLPDEANLLTAALQ